LSSGIVFDNTCSSFNKTGYLKEADKFAAIAGIHVINIINFIP